MIKFTIISLIISTSLQELLADNSNVKVDGLTEPGHEKFEDYAECKIYNKKYNNWYLHSEKRPYMSLKFSAFTAEKRNVTLRSFALFSDKKQSMWRFEPVDGIKNGFHLRNSKYDELLFASTYFHRIGFNPFTQKRRKIYISKMYSDTQMDSKSFVWIFSRTNRKDNEYYIHNLRYGE